MPKGEKTAFERWMKYLGIPVALAVFGLLYSVPTPAGLTVQGMTATGVFLGALVLWVSEAIPTYATSLLTIIALAITGAWDENSILGVFGYDVIWLMVSAFIIVSGMEKSGVAKRIALFMVSRFGNTARKALLVMLFTNFILAFIVPSTTARAAVLLPIAIVLAQAYGAVPGQSNFGRLLMIQELQVNNISTSGILTATAPQIMAVGFIKDLAGVQVSWMSWLIAAMPVAIVTMIISYLVGLLLYPPEVSAPKGKGIADMREELKSQGKINKDEWKALVIFALTIFLWATGPYHVKMFGINISLVMTAVIAATLFYLPFIGIIDWKKTSIPWDLMIFSCGAYAAGMALEKSGAASWGLEKIFGAMDLTKINFIVLFAIVMFIASFSHMLFTSKTVRAVILIPAIIGLAKITGHNPIALALPAAFTIADSITLPPNCKPNLIFYSTGQFSVLNQLSYGLIVLVGKWLVLCLASLTWFKWIGLY
ncbi:MAG: DASS family sodium-coupled anion symporter [Peptococcaceae bacterium]|nr:DASS family sodium-coupled anion symporter [Peptococcaceae bacterium]